MDLAEILDGVVGLHAVTHVAILFLAWRMIGDDIGRVATEIEAAALTASRSAGMARSGRGGGAGGRSSCRALSRPTALRATGPVPQRLARWIARATQATMAALLQFDRLRDWQARAEARTGDLSGRTPSRLIAALAAWPMLSAPLAGELTGAVRAAVQRSLDTQAARRDTLAARRLIHEGTGQGRYRVRAAG